MTVQDLKEALEAFIKNELPELQKMEDYYSGKHNILNKKDRSDKKKDTKLIIILSMLQLLQQLIS